MKTGDAYFFTGGVIFSSLLLSGCMTFAGPIQGTFWTNPSYPDGSREEAVNFNIDQTECATEAMNKVPDYHPQVRPQSRDSSVPSLYSAYREGRRAALEDALAEREYQRAIQVDSLRADYRRACMMKRGWRPEVRIINAR